MDAISFVLGIKSSHLRSSHLSDLVYRGRVLKTSRVKGDGSSTAAKLNEQVATDDGYQDREGQGDQQERNDPKYAWVTAVYEDDAGDQQLWKRTITNKGVSEYRINEAIVTAQQYHRSLEGENILIKARNFLVFQGDVEAIASQSPHDLTRLVEQISGSLEYKAEYETLREAQVAALENQNFNLNRRRGINAEIQQYQEQKREAVNFEKKSHQRDQAIVTQVLWKLYHIKRIVEISARAIQENQTELKENKRELQRNEQILEDKRRDQLRAGKLVSQVETAIKRKTKEIEDKENSLVPILEKIHLTEDHLRQVQNRLFSIKEGHTTRLKTVTKLKKDLQIVEKAEQQWKTELETSDRYKERALNEPDLQEYNRLKEEVSKRISSDQIKADTLARQRIADESTVNSMKSKVDLTKRQGEKLGEEVNQVELLRKAATLSIKDTSRAIETKKKEHHRLKSARLRSTQLRIELEEKLQEVLLKLIEAEDGRKQDDKEARARNMVADMKRIFPGVRGRMSELCKPKQKRYGEAVSMVLGRHFDAVIVNDEKTAKDCIQFLRDQQRGQATFIPLDTIQVRPFNSSFKGMYGGTRMAVDTIDFDKSIDRAVSYACGNAIICDDLEIAKYVCFEKGVKAKAVTLDGTVIHKGGLMTGGRAREQNTRIWEDVEVDNLRKLSEKLRRDLATVPEIHQNTIEEEGLQGDVTGLEQKLAFAKDEAEALDRTLTSKKTELSHLQRELQEMEPIFEKKLREFQSLTASLAEYKAACSEIEDQVFVEFCQRLRYDNIRVYEAQQGVLQQEAAEKKLEFKQQTRRLESRISFEQQQLREVENRVKNVQERIDQDQALTSELEGAKDSASEELDSLLTELEQETVHLEERKAIYGQKTEKLTEQHRKVQKRNKGFDNTKRVIADLEADIQRHVAERNAILRRCKLEDIGLPLTDSSVGLDQLPIDGILQDDPDGMDLDEDGDLGSFQPTSVADHGIEVDFSDLDDDMKEVSGGLRSHDSALLT